MLTSVGAVIRMWMRHWFIFFQLIQHFESQESLKGKVHCFTLEGRVKTIEAVQWLTYVLTRSLQRSISKLS